MTESERTDEVRTCPICGAAVADQALHAQWHGQYADYVGSGRGVLYALENAESQ